MAKVDDSLAKLIQKNYDGLLASWLTAQHGALKAGQAENGELGEQSHRFVRTLQQAAASGQLDSITGPAWLPVREVLEEVSRSRALKGFTPSETATFVFSFKESLFDVLRAEHGREPEALARQFLAASALLDKLGLYTTEVYQKSREEVIRRQQEEMLELSTPVVQLWDGILALPLIGTLDSARTQVVMENLLQEIVKSEAEIAIIDITGVPTVDTLVAQHLLKTVAAARLMGADCVISGIRPQIAQTLVHLGVELNVVSKATMADALALALRRIGKVVVDRKKALGERKMSAAVEE
jgi:rsbT co-antagonist protein RsbR